MVKLHLGCGKRRIPGWINVDIDPACEPDRLMDCFGSLFGWDKQDEAEVIYACHVLEHCERRQYKDVLANWHRILKPGGILRLSVPDLGRAMRWYCNVTWEEWRSDDSKLLQLLGFLYGGQRDEHDYHKMGWDEATLTRDLLAAGFREVRRYDRDKTEHADVDDYSAARLPHIRDCKSMEEYKRGTLMSLNLEAVK